MMDKLLIYFCLTFVTNFVWTKDHKQPKKDGRKLGPIKKVDPCRKLGINQLFELKNRIEKKLTQSSREVQVNKNIEQKYKNRQLKAIELFKKEINETETLFHESLRGLKRVLKGDYKSLRKLEETSKLRLKELKKATLLQEEEYNAILLAEKEEINELKKQGNENVSKSNTAIRKFIDQLLIDISNAADKLEVQLDDESFQKTFHAKKQDVEIETVLRVDEDSSVVSSDSSGVTNLIDSHNNQFVLSKPKDGTVTHVDSNLIRDIIYIVIFSLAFSIPCSWLRVPNFFAYILTGIVLGPSGINYLKVINAPLFNFPFFCQQFTGLILLNLYFLTSYNEFLFNKVTVH